MPPFPTCISFFFLPYKPHSFICPQRGSSGLQVWHLVCSASSSPSLDSLSERDWCKPFAQPQTLQGHHMAGLDKTLWYFYSFIPNQLTVNPWHPSKGTRLFIQLSEKTQTHFDTVSANPPDNLKLAKRTSLMSCKP